MRLRRVALHINVKKVFPLPRAGGPRFKTRHGHTMLFEGHEQVVHGTGAVGHRHDQTGAVEFGRRRGGQGLGQAHHHKAGAVVGLILNSWCHGVQAKLRACTFAGNGGPLRVVFGKSGPFSIAGGSAPLGMGQVGCEPVLTLSQRLRVGQHHFNAF